ncbi:MAG TPA: hypothetical protein VF796_19735, partial [Humisphaera sp.]
MSLHTTRRASVAVALLLCTFAAARPAAADNRAPEKGLTPQETLEHMKVADGLAVTLFAGEPDVRQPIACCVDDRGRLWVAENYDYSPKGNRKQDKNRILIFTDADGDGRFDSVKVFADNLGFVSAVQVGFGGV